MRHRGLLPVLIAFAVAGCSRYEWVPDYLTPECAHRQGSANGFVDATSSVETTEPTVLSGRVVAKESRQALGEAKVGLRGDVERMVTTDSVGRFRIDGLPPGRYRLEVQRIGYARTSDSVSVPLASGHQVEVQMVVSVLDGPCSGFAAVQVRKPWWKFW